LTNIATLTSLHSHRIAEVDYDVYAAGEAALGWMNLAATLRAAVETDWDALARTARAGASVSRAGVRADGICARNYR
jgi:hypothetical protein